MPAVYSHSRLSCFENCPKQFHYRYVLKVKIDSESIEAFLGKRVHEVLERLHLFVGRGMVPSVERVVQRYRALWKEKFDASRIRIVREEDTAEYYEDLGEGCLRRFYHRHYPFDADETLGVEQLVRVEIGSVRVRGIIDRLVRAPDGAVEIHDYKTGRRIPSQKRLDADRQLALYQLAIQDKHPDSPIRLVWHYLRQGATRTSTRTPEQLDALRREVVERVAEIERETAFEAKPSALCAWCEFNDRCPASSAPQRSRPAAPAPVPQEPEWIGEDQLQLL